MFFAFISDKSDENYSDACVYSRKLCHDKLKSTYVSDKSGNVNHVLYARSKSKCTREKE